MLLPVVCKALLGSDSPKGAHNQEHYSYQDDENEDLWKVSSNHWLSSDVLLGRLDLHRRTDEKYQQILAWGFPNSGTTSETWPFFTVLDRFPCCPDVM